MLILDSVSQHCAEIWEKYTWRKLLWSYRAQQCAQASVRLVADYNDIKFDNIILVSHVLIIVQSYITTIWTKTFGRPPPPPKKKRLFYERFFWMAIFSRVIVMLFSLVSHIGLVPLFRIDDALILYGQILITSIFRCDYGDQSHVFLYSLAFVKKKIQCRFFTPIE